MEALSERQAQILEFLQRHIESQGRPPTQAELALAFGFKGRTAARDQLLQLARKGYIEFNEGTARGLRVLRSPLSALPANRVPIVGRIAAGSPVLSDENVEDFLTIDPDMFRPRADYFRRVQGESMVGANIFDGDLVGLHATYEAARGQIVAVRIEDPSTGEPTLTLKRLQREREVVVLYSENPDQDSYPPIRLDPRQQLFQVEGLFVGLIRSRTH